MIDLDVLIAQRDVIEPGLRQSSAARDVYESVVDLYVALGRLAAACTHGCRRSADDGLPNRDSIRARCGAGKAVVGREGFEPSTYGLRVRCSTN